MAHVFLDRFPWGLMVCLAVLLLTQAPGPAAADDCKRVSNVLVLFDASGFMKEKDRWDQMLKQMSYFQKAMPLTADGFFNAGLRHYGLKVGLGCDNTESILAVQPWDPERFLNSLPKTVSYGTSSLSAGLRAAADDLAGASGKSVIVVVGGGLESCSADPAKITEQICRNNPDLEIHTFQVGGSQDGAFFLKAIAQNGRGTYNNANSFGSSADWYRWMKQFLVMPCAGQAQEGAPVAGLSPVTFDNNSFSVRSRDPMADAANQAVLASVAQILRQSPMARVVLHGYSDGKGKPDVNLRLSKQRAESVAQFLTGTHGIPAGRISVIGHGATQTMPPGAGPAQDRMGRRVEFEIQQ